MKRELFYQILAISSLAAVFGLGYFTANLAKPQKPAVVVEKITDNTYSTANNEILQGYDDAVVASVNSDKFHFEWCPGAKRIKAENKIYFSDAQEAAKAGYTLAGNCK